MPNTKTIELTMQEGNMLTYDQLMEKVLDGKSVNARAKEIGIPQVTLNNYKRGSRIPSCAMTIKLAEVAGIAVEEAVRAVAEKEMDARPVQTGSFLRPAMASVLGAIIAVNLFLTPTPSEATPLFKEAQNQFVLCKMDYGQTTRIPSMALV
jgi:transcriptional regulator with XRE-family HTH domain